MITTSIFEVADYFLHHANLLGESITMSKLQKLCYYAQAWHLAFYGEPIFMSCYEYRAWPCGPVNLELDEKLELYEYIPIKKDTSEFQESVFTEKQLLILKQVWKKYGKLHEKTLETLIYQEEPFRKAREEKENNEDDLFSGVIQESDMEAYYLRKWVDARKLNQ
ncbi:Panacea domain-containing protein [Paenibacillus larvae]|uniref:Putative prophage protein n=1 Tax=Paenibacillus larvae subsp. larvae TaxID=147375 RepID=A0A6C0QX64_9BACL|nr:type II toxin-antitoxin system antitoxin SocA domain-containing protein [Paenibacillus larvae]QHZ53365.1 putative prophage protein [Paenibacillus larvae subsp. larvae]